MTPTRKLYVIQVRAGLRRSGGRFTYWSLRYDVEECIVEIYAGSWAGAWWCWLLHQLMPQSVWNR